MRRIPTQAILFDEVLNEENNIEYILDNINDYDYFEILLIDVAKADEMSRYAKVINNHNDWEGVLRNTVGSIEILFFSDGILMMSIDSDLYNMMKLTIIGGKY